MFKQKASQMSLNFKLHAQIRKCNSKFLTLVNYADFPTEFFGQMGGNVLGQDPHFYNMASIPPLLTTKTHQMFKLSRSCPLLPCNGVTHGTFHELNSFHLSNALLLMYRNICHTL